MFIKKTFRPLSVLLGIVILLAACGPDTSAPDGTMVAELIQTSVALTIAAEHAAAGNVLPSLSSVSQETATPTETLIPTATFTPSPTFTPFVFAPTSSGSSGGVVIQADYACGVWPYKPRDNTVFKRNESFDIVWTITNTGSKKWDAGFDLRYLSGPQMTATTIVSLPEIKPGEDITVRFDANAPNEKGFHVMTWKINNFCYPYVAINVE